jgi:hypothetical protein
LIQIAEKKGEGRESTDARDEDKRDGQREKVPRAYAETAVPGVGKTT